MNSKIFSTLIFLLINLTSSITCVCIKNAAARIDCSQDYFEGFDYKAASGIFKHAAVAVDSPYCTQIGK